MKRILFMFSMIVLCLLFVYGNVTTHGAEKAGISVTMFDIGQGDSFLIRVNGKTIMVDTGEKSFYGFLQQQLDHLGVNKVDTLIISHMTFLILRRTPITISESCYRRLALPAETKI